MAEKWLEEANRLLLHYRKEINNRLLRGTDSMHEEAKTAVRVDGTSKDYSDLKVSLKQGYFSSFIDLGAARSKS